MVMTSDKRNPANEDKMWSVCREYFGSMQRPFNDQSAGVMSAAAKLWDCVSAWESRQDHMYAFCLCLPCPLELVAGPFSEWEMFQTKFVEKIETHVYVL